MVSEYYLGANTPQGFYSLFNELYNPYDDWNMYILKGGPGTGKSTIMKQIASAATEKGIDADIIPCSSDPDSLDAVIIKSMKVAICDGTSPHVVEPVFPGVCEHIVNLCDCWDKNKLKENKSKIKLISMTNKSAHQKCIKYLKTAKLIDDEIYSYIKPYINYEKIERFTDRITEIKNNDKKEHKSEIRFLSAVTPKGIKIKYNTFMNDCEKIIKIKDNYNISGLITESIIKKCETDIIKYNCVLNPETKTDHIIIPELKLGIFTSNNIHTLTDKTYRTVSTDRFTDKEKTEKHSKTIKFLNKTKVEMINEAVESLKTAKSAHDILESYYIEAMNFDKVNIIKDKLIKEIFS